MNAVIKFFGDSLSRLNANLGYAILFFACFVKVITYITTYHDIKTLQIFDLIQPQYNDILKKYANNSQKRASELLILQKKNGCRVFTGADTLLIHSIIAACLTYIFIHPQYLYALNFTSYHFLWIKDLSLSPLILITREEISPLIELIGYLIIPAAAAGIYYYLAKYIAGKSFLTKANQQRVILAAIIAAGLFMPQVVILYLFAVLSLTALQYFVTVKYFPLKMKNHQNKSI